MGIDLRDKPAAYHVPVYRRRPDSSQRVYAGLCDVLAGRSPDWSALNPEDWNLLAIMSQPGNEGVGPLLHWHFNQHGWPDETPEQVREALQRMYYLTLAQNTLILEQRIRISQKLAQAGIPAVVLKGSAYLDSLYPDVGLRPMGDLDLLLDSGQIQRARGVLSGLGYEDEKPELWPGINQESGYHITMSYVGHPSQQINVELHWNLLSGRKAPPTSWFWQNLLPVGNNEKGEFGILAPTAALLFGAAHLGYKHVGRRERLIWFYDLHLMLSRLGDEIDWDEVLEKACEYDWVTGVYYMLNGALVRFGAYERLPNDAAWAAKAEMPEYERFIQSSFSSPAAGLSRLGMYDFQDKLKRSMALVFPSPAYMRWRYQPSPEWTWPLYYPVRGWNWLVKSLGIERISENRPAKGIPEAIEGPVRAPRLYSRLPGDSNHVYRTICRVLSAGRGDWRGFGEDEWNVFLLMVQPFNEGVGPLLYWKLEEDGWPAPMPARVRSALKKMYYQTFAQNTLILAQKERILDAFNRRGIPALVLKGPAFIESLYPDIGLRPMGDLDILVELRHLEAAGRLMAELGFKKERPDIRPGVFHNSGFQLVIPNENGVEQKLNIELHWQLLNGKSVPDMDWFWQNKASLGINGQQMAGLNPEAAFLYGAAHLGYKHYGRRERLIWYYDLYLMFDRLKEEIDWPRMLEKSTQFDWLTGVYYALKGVQHRFGVEGLLPNSGEWEQRVDFSGYRRFLKRSYSPAGIFLNRLSFFDFAGGLRLAVSWVFPSGDYMRWRYAPKPDWLWPLYYPYRWFKWLQNLFKSI